MKTAFRLFLVFLILSANLWASDSSSPWFTQGPDKKIIINVELFLSSTCPHCHKADAFFSAAAATSPQLHIQRHVINEDKDALLRFNQLLSEQNMSDFAVPSIYFCNSRWVGYASDETTGKDLMHAINYCKQQIEKDGTLTQATVDTLRHWANANKFDSGIVGNPSTWFYIFTVALTDAFAPCAFFGFAGFLVFLFVQNNRKKQLIASLLFVLPVGLVHYFQQTHASAFYELLPWMRVPAALVGILAIYFIVQCYKKQFNDRLYYLLAFLVGLMVMIYQQTCVMNWSYIFEQWLNNKQISTVEHGLYQLLYQLLYLLPLIVILFIYLGVSLFRRVIALHTRLFSIGLLFLAVIALCLIIYPLWLTSLTGSVIVFLILAVYGWFLNLT